MGQALVKTKFFTFPQNNSGGSFHYDFFAGIGRYVIVEAIDQEHATTRAQQIGLYFDGSGDCSCCGYRWSEPWDEEGTEEPEIYGQPVEQYLAQNGWLHNSREHQVFVHRLTGQINAHGANRSSSDVEVAA